MFFDKLSNLGTYLQIMIQFCSNSNLENIPF